MKEVKCISPQDVGWIEAKLSDDEMSFLWDCVKNSKKDYRKKLAGVVSSSLELEDSDGWFARNVIFKLVEKYGDTYENRATIPGLLHGVKHPLRLDQFWVNFQNETEYNPPHMHFGIYSFVIWMKIPTRYKDQKNIPWIKPSQKNANTVSNFRFEYVDMVGGIREHTYEMNPEMEGTLLLFPGQLRHGVFPFYNCKEERISISGNIRMDTTTVQYEV